MNRCTQPGCTGEVEADGFCDVCGMAPAAAPAAAPPPAESAAGPVAESPANSVSRPAPAAPAPQMPPARAAAPVRPAAPVAPGYPGAYGRPPNPAPVTTPATPAAPVGAPPGPPVGAPPGSSGPSGPGSSSGGSSSSGSPTSGSRSVGSGRTASRGGTRGTGSSGSARRGMLGAGLVEVPPVPARDPASAIMDKPEVPENRRFCSKCDEKVGRSRGGRPGRTEGFCRNCGHPFSFTPKLHPGEMIGGQYEVLGCLAHGGLGWVYLARDHNVSERWVVLKGLLDTGDADSLAAATAERAFLAEVEHPNIVKIYNFVRHGDSGYIVMEYVGGRSLKDILLSTRKQQGEHAALPLGQVIAYGLEVLSALGYLHGVGLLYCDFKPDNAIQSEEQLKLIDLGGVRRAFDVDSPIFGTPGYQAPEIGSQGPSITSDLYTVGRTLAVLSFPFRGYTGRHLRSLPPREEVPLFQRYESYHRLLRRATHPDPARRFQSAAEMAEQLTGVLREVLSAEDGRPRPAPSPLFGPEQQTAGTEIVEGLEHTAANGAAPPILARLEPAAAAAALPVPLVYASDPAAAFLAGLTARDPADLAAALGSAPVASREVRLALVRVRIELGDLDGAARLLEDIAAEAPDDWRVDWYRGARALAGGRGTEAVAVFNDLYDLAPGEQAPKLALAFCHETLGDMQSAGHFYETVWRTDPTHVSAAFGLARTRLAAGDRASAERVLDSVPNISSHYLSAQLAAVATTVRGRRPAELTAPALIEAGRRLASLRLDTERSAAFTAEVLEAALGWLRAGRGSAPPGIRQQVLGTDLDEQALRKRLEDTYRVLAKLADGSEHRHAMVKRANAVRPRTLF
ncbi:serine/threonine-protein kinase PknG [Actinomadura madurae]|uniref:serine/threonine-protein kinase n=1 Tax=Actinomadura madurae TaxID=1993 RepID=UPI002025DF02|nr:serine/threonine-protein kinase [Actinomadura madurae]URM97324.1 serine/threonine-protein kinase PknG [Actinomadura madurae]URN08090.1 serine/threonine-protein kinase PknG [Actinomadura madurae]